MRNWFKKFRKHQPSVRETKFCWWCFDEKTYSLISTGSDILVRCDECGSCRLVW